VDVHGTDAADRTEIRRQNDGSVDVRLLALDHPDDPPYFSRRFVSAETREVRVYLHGGADQVDSSGSGPPDIKVRVICGSDSAAKDAFDRRP
jgi:hypothetical protein